jgi:HAD superfamily hydrolase (TIGR01509 family)
VHHQQGGTFYPTLARECGARRLFRDRSFRRLAAAKKPDPLPLLQAARFFNVEPQELLLIGDSVNDVQAACAAGCLVFVMPYGYNEG